MDVRQAIAHRRSYYSIEKKSALSDESIVELVSFATQHVPSAFHSQSQMAVVLLGEKHDRLWDLVLKRLRPVVPPEAFAATQTKIGGFKAGYGTVLFFNDDSITTALQEEFAFYAHKFPTWVEQANGMLHFAVWTLLESEGFGASLQHYNPLIDDDIQAVFEVPKSWRLIAQMPFGIPTAEPDAKKGADITTRVKWTK